MYKRFSAALSELSRVAEDRRREVRRSVEIPASLASVEADDQAAVLRDISCFGFMAETDQGPAPGTLVRISIPGLGVQAARVIWSAGRKLGCEFVRPIARTLLNAALAGTCIVGAAAPSEAATATGTLPVSLTISGGCETFAIDSPASLSAGGAEEALGVRCSQPTPYKVVSSAVSSMTSDGGAGQQLTIVY